MLDIRKDDGPHSKVFFSHTLLPGYIDPRNPSTKKKPFSTFLAQPFSHTVDLILPEEIYELVQAHLEKASVGQLHYARVFMRLGELLEGDFFTEYIKKGNIMMLSEGRPLADNVFSLYEGKLRLELDRATYERCGLVGQPVEDGGRKHQKARWVVEYDLRAPSMLHGKKGFSRLEWACRNVLNQSLMWLFSDLRSSTVEALRKGPIAKHHPFVATVQPETSVLENVASPNLTISGLSGLYKQEVSMALLEWLHLANLNSPRVRQDNQIDSFLSRYEVPDFGGEIVSQGLVRVRWRGFISPRFVRELYLRARKHSLQVEEDKRDGEGGTSYLEEDRWCAITAKAFEGYGGCYTVMQFAGRDTLTWECD
ncbi:ribonuclease P 40kDa subunit-domain-containing protein [Lophiotrema nucula]|uniref:Ribonuclease P 40kDa subunit-domain-containing protein n=1 Tax=Lophiotrema nucula TaxID=690887 RepID=A0A6A5ZPM2_9PLEO|nr:ribonuclease P 40kDa subunit-domain-containing protein [Lophiotrema nucula]